MTPIAVTRPVSQSIVRCELTHIPRQPIDYARAVEQHNAYETVLAALGCRLVRVPAEHDMPDAVFVEDVAVVLDEVAVMTRPGVVSRRAEVDGVSKVLARYRPLVSIETPGTLDGGDVLRAGSRLFVGRSSRSNDAGIAQLGTLVKRFGCTVIGLDVRGCLHLKSAVTAVGVNTFLVNGKWVDQRAFVGVEWVEVDPSEPHAANALWVGDGVLYPRAFVRTGERLEKHLEARGLSLHRVDVSELAKAEGGVTCCSLIVTNP